MSKSSARLEQVDYQRKGHLDHNSIDRLSLPGFRPNRGGDNLEDFTFDKLLASLTPDTPQGKVVYLALMSAFLLSACGAAAGNSSTAGAAAETGIGPTPPDGTAAFTLRPMVTAEILSSATPLPATETPLPILTPTATPDLRIQSVSIETARSFLGVALPAASEALFSAGSNNPYLADVYSEEFLTSELAKPDLANNTRALYQALKTQIQTMRDAQGVGSLCGPDSRVLHNGRFDDYFRAMPLCITPDGTSMVWLQGFDGRLSSHSSIAQGIDASRYSWGQLSLEGVRPEEIAAVVNRGNFTVAAKDETKGGEVLSRAFVPGEKQWVEPIPPTAVSQEIIYGAGPNQEITYLTPADVGLTEQQWRDRYGDLQMSSVVIDGRYPQGDMLPIPLGISEYRSNWLTQGDKEMSAWVRVSKNGVILESVSGNISIIVDFIHEGRTYKNVKMVIANAGGLYAFNTLTGGAWTNDGGGIIYVPQQNSPELNERLQFLGNIITEGRQILVRFYLSDTPLDPQAQCENTGPNENVQSCFSDVERLNEYMEVARSTYLNIKSEADIGDGYIGTGIEIMLPFP